MSSLIFKLLNVFLAFAVVCDAIPVASDLQPVFDLQLKTGKPIDYVSNDMGFGYDATSSDILRQPVNGEFGAGDPGRSSRNGKYLLLPVIDLEAANDMDLVQIDERFMRAKTSTTETLSSVEDITRSMSVDVSISAGYEGAAVSASFAASASFQEMVNSVSKRDSVTSRVSMRSVVAAANFEDRFAALPLSKFFKETVRKVATTDAFTGDMFIDYFGTHYIWSTSVGCMLTSTMQGTSTFMSDASNVNKAFSASIAGSYAGVSASVSAAGSTTQNSVSSTSTGLEKQSVTQLGGSPDSDNCGGVVSPVRLELRPFLSLIDTRVDGLTDAQRWIAIAKIHNAQNAYFSQRTSQKQQIASRIPPVTNLPARSTDLYLKGSRWMCSFRVLYAGNVRDEAACKAQCITNANCEFVHYHPSLRACDLRWGMDISDAGGLSTANTVCREDKPVCDVIIPAGKTVTSNFKFNLDKVCEMQHLRSQSTQTDSECFSLCKNERSCSSIQWDQRNSPISCILRTFLLPNGVIANAATKNYLRNTVDRDWNCVWLNK